jgi:hypothetical protein
VMGYEVLSPLQLIKSLLEPMLLSPRTLTSC